MLLLAGGLIVVTVLAIHATHEVDDLRNNRAEQTDHSPATHSDTRKDTFPVRLTGDDANRPLNWQDTLDELYDPKDSAKGNLDRLDNLGGDRARAAIADMRKRDPAATPEEMLSALFSAWGRPNKR